MLNAVLKDNNVVNYRYQKNITKIVSNEVIKKNKYLIFLLE